MMEPPPCRASPSPQASRSPSLPLRASDRATTHVEPHHQSAIGLHLFGAGAGGDLGSGGLGSGADGGSITVLAGTPGGPGYADDVGAHARYDEPDGVALDNAGNLYVADHRNMVIRKLVLASGQVSTLAGAAGQRGNTDGPLAAARFTRTTNPPGSSSTAPATSTSPTSTPTPSAS